MSKINEYPSIVKCTHKKNGFPCFIPAQRVLNLVGKKWSIQLINVLSNGRKVRYNEIRELLHKGWKKNKISDATLSARLSELSKEGVLIRDVHPEIPPKVEYSLSEKGQDLAEALQPLIDWTIKTCHE
ncbi:MAG: helix-turn-helix transcriptional regulator [Candidatus Heimdallarchaeota archaeon]|jgi:DNA-binding HxlR family transcriptional regulator|nr:helix-turn-helix transcriptional regulator [Candidatus Heimdallarchaeota archaeon]